MKRSQTAVVVERERVRSSILSGSGLFLTRCSEKEPVSDACVSGSDAAGTRNSTPTAVEVMLPSSIARAQARHKKTNEKPQQSRREKQ